jgi:hypothetical protein
MTFYWWHMTSGKRRLAAWTIALGVIAAGGGLLFLHMREPLYDRSFDSRVTEPAYRSRHPRVLFDAGHHNHHTADGRYKPFADLVRNDGCDVQSIRTDITSASLSGIAVFVTACPQGANETNDADAFTESEVAAIDEWVRAGGSLLLITDHFPFGSAAECLSRRFGVDMSKGLVQDAKHFEASLEETHIVFSGDSGLHSDHPIIRGRAPAEQVKRVLTFTGQSLGCPERGAKILLLADSAVDRPPTTPIVERSGGDVRVTVNYGDPVPAKGRAQAVALEVGKGRAVILGEAGMLSAQKTPRGAPVGMNYPDYDNRQFALNIMHWLSRLL